MEETYKQWLDGATGNFPYINPAGNNLIGTSNGIPIYDEQFPIVASGLKYNNGNGVLPEEDLKEAKNAGINVVMQNAITSSQIKNSLSNAINAGVRLMFFNAGFFNNGWEGVYFTGIDGTITENREAFGGIKLMDEPLYCQLAGTECTNADDTKFNLLGRYRNFMDQDPKCLIYINLVGSAVGKYMPPHDNTEEDIDVYKKYVETYQKNFRPAFFCFDHYPVRECNNLLYEGINLNEDSHPEGEITISYDWFEKVLGLYASLSREHSRPFWLVCRSLSYMNLGSSFFRPVVTEQYLGYVMFTAISYGAKGFVYWTYSMEPTVSGSESRFSSFYDRHGKKMETWNCAQKINNEIHRYKDIFLKMTPQIPEIITASKYLRGYNPNFEFTIEVSGSERGVLLSTVKEYNKVYFLIVNRSPLDYVNLDLVVNTGLIRELTPIKSGGETNKFLDPRNNPRVLPPGGFRILEVKVY